MTTIMTNRWIHAKTSIKSIKSIKSIQSIQWWLIGNFILFPPFILIISLSLSFLFFFPLFSFQSGRIDCHPWEILAQLWGRQSPPPPPPPPPPPGREDGSSVVTCNHQKKHKNRWRRRRSAQKNRTVPYSRIQIIKNKLIEKRGGTSTKK